MKSAPNIAALEQYRRGRGLPLSASLTEWISDPLTGPNTEKRSRSITDRSTRTRGICRNPLISRENDSRGLVQTLRTAPSNSQKAIGTSSHMLPRDAHRRAIPIFSSVRLSGILAVFPAGLGLEPQPWALAPTRSFGKVSEMGKMYGLCQTGFGTSSTSLSVFALGPMSRCAGASRGAMRLLGALLQPAQKSLRSLLQAQLGFV